MTIGIIQPILKSDIDIEFKANLVDQYNENCLPLLLQQLSACVLQHTSNGIVLNLTFDWRVATTDVPDFEEMVLTVIPCIHKVLFKRKCAVMGRDFSILMFDSEFIETTIDFFEPIMQYQVKLKLTNADTKTILEATAK